jgi:uncharacterized integral membrane protein
MNTRIRNVIPPVYALLIVGGFLISASVGLIVLIVGAMLTGVLWSMLSGGDRTSGGRDRSDRATARAARRR